VIGDDYYIDRVRPGRFRMLINPKQGGTERIVIDDMQWARTDAAAPWLKTSVRNDSGVLPSIADLFRNGLSGASETAAPDGSRRVEGTVSWTNGASCEGKVLFRIDAAGLPVLFRFDGICGGQPMRFRQAFSYSGPVTIDPPQ
jgi:hypothetical protein